MRRETAAWDRRRGGATWVAALCAVALVYGAAPADAVDLSTQSFKLNLDTTLSWGVASRVDSRDKRLVGLANGGTAYSVNGDDGNFNFDKGVFSNTFKLTSELDMGWEHFGAFVRVSGFYDYEIEHMERERTELSDAALSRVGSRADVLDYYLWATFEIGGKAAEVRVGNQVVSWGESTFIPGGINVINPVNVAALRVPGAELREALVPVGMVWASLATSANTGFELFYQYDWYPTKIDPPGSYFSTNDFAGSGGTHVFLGFGSPSDITPSPFFIQPPLSRPFLGVPRAETQNPKEGGQYGVAFRWLVPALGNTEFGLYFLNYHSRLPVVNGISGTVQGAQAAAQAGPRAAGEVYKRFGVPPGASPTVDAIARQAASAAATDAYASTARYFTAYPEDIKLYGLSLNTQLGTSGIALQGEVSYRQDAPILVDDVELLFAALSPISPGLAATNQVVPGGVRFSTVIDGFILRDVAQAQATATKSFGPGLGADQSVFVLEVAGTFLQDAPDRRVLRLEGPGTYTSGNPIHSGPTGAHAGKAYEQPEHFADSTSWGYRLAGRLDYNNAVGAFNLSPRFAWQQDVAGVSPAPGGNFIEGLHALTLGISAAYQNSWEIDFSFTAFGGAGRWNLLNDRDFVQTTVKYSF